MSSVSKIIVKENGSKKKRNKNRGSKPKVNIEIDKINKKKTATQKVIEVVHKKFNVRHRRLNMSQFLDLFIHAQLFPFEEVSEGCIVPRLGLGMQAPYKCRTYITLGQTSSSTCAIILLPNPIFTVIDCFVITTNSTANTCIASNGSLNQVGTASTYQKGLYGFIPESTIANAYGDYANVSYGFHLSSVMEKQYLTGQWVAAPVPMTPDVDSWDVVTGTSTWDATMFDAWFGQTLSNLASGSIIQLPGAFTFTSERLDREDLELLPLYTSTSAFDVRNCEDQPNLNAAGTYLRGDDVVEHTGSPNAIQTVGVKSLTDMSGRMAWCLYGSGLPTTGGSSVVSVDMISHQAGSPEVGAALIPSGCQSGRVVGGTLELEKAIMAANRQGGYRWCPRQDNSNKNKLASIR